MTTLENWPEDLKTWLEKQHGTAGWEQKLESFISMLLRLQRERDAEIVGKLIGYYEHIPTENVLKEARESILMQRQ